MKTIFLKRNDVGLNVANEALSTFSHYRLTKNSSRFARANKHDLIFKKIVPIIYCNYYFVIVAANTDGVSVSVNQHYVANILCEIALNRFFLCFSFCQVDKIHFPLCGYAN